MNPKDLEGLEPVEVQSKPELARAKAQRWFNREKMPFFTKLSNSEKRHLRKRFFEEELAPLLDKGGTDFAELEGMFDNPNFGESAVREFLHTTMKRGLQLSGPGQFLPGLKSKGEATIDKFLGIPETAANNPWGQLAGSFAADAPLFYGSGMAVGKIGELVPLLGKTTSAAWEGSKLGPLQSKAAAAGVRAARGALDIGLPEASMAAIDKLTPGQAAADTGLGSLAWTMSKRGPAAALAFGLGTALGGGRENRGDSMMDVGLPLALDVFLSKGAEKKMLREAFKRKNAFMTLSGGGKKERQVSRIFWELQKDLETYEKASVEHLGARRLPEAEQLADSKLRFHREMAVNASNRIQRRAQTIDELFARHDPNSEMRLRVKNEFWKIQEAIAKQPEEEVAYLMAQAEDIELQVRNILALPELESIPTHHVGLSKGGKNSLGGLDPDKPSTQLLRKIGEKPIPVDKEFWDEGKSLSELLFERTKKGHLGRAENRLTLSRVKTRMYKHLAERSLTAEGPFTLQDLKIWGVAREDLWKVFRRIDSVGALGSNANPIFYNLEAKQRVLQRIANSGLPKEQQKKVVATLDKVNHSYHTREMLEESMSNHMKQVRARAAARKFAYSAEGELQPGVQITHIGTGEAAPEPDDVLDILGLSEGFINKGTPGVFQTSNEKWADQVLSGMKGHPHKANAIILDWTVGDQPYTFVLRHRDGEIQLVPFRSAHSHAGGRTAFTDMQQPMTKERLQYLMTEAQDSGCDLIRAVYTDDPEGFFRAVDDITTPPPAQGPPPTDGGPELGFLVPPGVARKTGQNLAKAWRKMWDIYESVRDEGGTAFKEGEARKLVPTKTLMEYYQKTYNIPTRSLWLGLEEDGMRPLHRWQKTNRPTVERIVKGKQKMKGKSQTGLWEYIKAQDLTERGHVIERYGMSTEEVKLAQDIEDLLHQSFTVTGKDGKPVSMWQDMIHDDIPHYISYDEISPTLRPWMNQNFDPTQTDIFQFVNNVWRTKMRLHLSPWMEKFAELRKEVTNMDHIPDRAKNGIRKDISQYLGRVAGSVNQDHVYATEFIQLLNDQLGLELRGSEMSNFVNHMLLGAYASAMPFRLGTASRNLSQTITTTMLYVGPKRWGRGFRRAVRNKPTLNGQTISERLGFHEFAPMPLEHDLPTGKVIRKAYDVGMVGFKWADKTNRILTSNMAYDAIEELGPKYLKGKISLDQFKLDSGLIYLEKPSQQEVLAPFLKYMSELENFHNGWQKKAPKIEEAIDQAGYNFARNLTEDTQWVYRAGSSPALSASKWGRFFGQFSTWPAHYVQFFRRGLRTGNSEATEQFMMRWLMVNTALMAAGDNLFGIDVRPWLFFGPMTYTGGPALQAVARMTQGGAGMGDRLEGMVDTIGDTIPNFIPFYRAGKDINDAMSRWMEGDVSGSFKELFGYRSDK